MRAKQLLAQRFRGLGYEAILEDPYPRQGRRVDITVIVPGKSGPAKIAVEIQDSAIAVTEVKRRMKADRASGFFATLWVFTTGRMKNLRRKNSGDEMRLPEEVRFLDNRWRLPVNVLDVNRELLMLMTTGDVTREGSSFYSPDGEEMGFDGRTLRATREIFLADGSFQIAPAKGRYAEPGKPDWTARFVEA